MNKKLNKISIRRLALIPALLVLFFAGCKPKTAGDYVGSVSFTYGDFRAQQVKVEGVNLTVVKTGVDKQYGRWNTHTITFDEKSPMKCSLEIELEGWRGDEDEQRTGVKEGMYSQVVKRQNCKMTGKDGKTYTARVTEGEIIVFYDSVSGEDNLRGTIKLMSEESEEYGEYNVRLDVKRK